jgi:hydrogenase-4 component F
MVAWIVVLPFAAGLLAFATPWNRVRPLVVLAAALGHATLVGRALLRPDAGMLRGWLQLDDLGRIVLLLVSGLFAVVALYAVGYLRRARELSNRVFCACLLGFLGTMSLLACAQHLGLLWVAVEATTLATAPLICFHRTPLALEATWKYLLICSVGIALALLGSFFLGYAALHGGQPTSLLFADLLHSAPGLSAPWLQAAFVLLLVGYGTKMGLAPLHTWLPDAHGEAPAPVSALLSGALLPCAFLPILRVQHLCHAAGHAGFARWALITLGLVSLLVAAVYDLRQRDLKRMLAYSSVEHMGMLALGTGVGGLALWGVLLHILTHGATKGLLFLAVGNVYQVYGSKSLDQVSGVLRRLPLTGVLLLAGFFAITGSPPFGPFVSTLAIVSGALQGGYYAVAGVFLALLLVVFIGIGRTTFTALRGQPAAAVGAARDQPGWLGSVPLLVLLAATLLLGVYIPPPLQTLLQGAVRFLEVRP